MSPSQTVSSAAQSWRRAGYLGTTTRKARGLQGASGEGGAPLRQILVPLGPGWGTGSPPRDRGRLRMELGAEERGEKLGGPRAEIGEG